MASVYSGAGEGRYGTVTVKGMVEFGMQYNYKQGALEIHVKQCKDLAAVNKNRSDPYVKVIGIVHCVFYPETEIFCSHFAGLFVTRQIKEWKTQNESEKAHPQSSV